MSQPPSWEQMCPLFGFPEVFVPWLLCSHPVHQASICSPRCCQIWNQLDIPVMAGSSLPVIPWLPLYSPQDSALLVVSHPTLSERAWGETIGL